MRIALTGATGFLGHYLIRVFLSAGHDVTAWCRCDPVTTSLPDGVEWTRGELGQPDAAETLVGNADAVVHAGWFRGGPSFLDAGDDPVGYWRTNATGSLMLLEAAAGANAKRFVFVSSGAVHDRVIPSLPLDEKHPKRCSTLYGACKASIESMIQHYGFSGKLITASLRPTSIYGVDDPVEQSKWFGLVRQVVSGQSVEATGGSKSVHAADVAKATLLLLEQDDSIAGEAFECSDRMISNHEVATLAKQISGSAAQITGQPKTAKNAIKTEKLQSLGMRFGGETLLSETVEQFVKHARA